MPSKLCQVIDFLDDGYSVLEILAICLKQKYSMYHSCDFSIKEASIVIRKFGSTTTTIQEIMNLN